MKPSFLTCCNKRICVFDRAPLKQGFGSWQIRSSEWKKDLEHQCALISQNMLSKTNTLIFYMTKTLNTFCWMNMFCCCRFLNQIWLQKPCFKHTQKIWDLFNHENALGTYSRFDNKNMLIMAKRVVCTCKLFFILKFKNTFTQS